MNQENELQAVKRRIRALSCMSIDRGATEHEAFVAMEKVGNLLQQYNLSMNEVLLSEEPCIHKEFPTFSNHRNVIFDVWSGIRDLCGIKIWITRPRYRGKWDPEKKGIVWHFFGLESDVLMALYLSDFITKAEVTALEEFKQSDVYTEYKGHRRPLTSSFKEGFGERVSKRLYEYAKANQEEEKKSHQYHQEKMKNNMISATDSAKAEHARQTTGTELISVTKERMIEEEYNKQLGRKLVKESSSYASQASYHGDSYRAGKESANKINLNRPISSSSANFGGYLK